MVEGSERQVFEEKTLPCPICGTEIPLRRARNGTFYLTCNACGMRCFLHGPRAVEIVQAVIERRGTNGVDRPVERPIGKGPGQG